MDVAYKQHSSHARRKNRSATNLNHLSLAPLTTKMPLPDPDELPDLVTSPIHYNPSYLQGKSAPTTPRLLQSPSRTRNNSPRRRASIPDASAAAALAKSKSTTHLHSNHPQNGRRHNHHRHHAHNGSSPSFARRRHDDDERRDSDWMLRTGALISSETREFKGQAWLVSRASSTSLTGVRDADQEMLDRELARERELASRRGSRRGSLVGHEEGFMSPGSRYGSRSHSRVGSRSQLRTPLERFQQQTVEGYFAQQQQQDAAVDENIPGPDFVGLDEKLEAIELDTSEADELTVRKLVGRRSVGVGAWMWSLFAVEENDEDSDTADGEDGSDDGESGGSAIHRSASTVDFEGFNTLPDLQTPAPKGDEGGWQDAAWLLSVASKVLL